uniref:Putative homing endonuclease n=1 Tax=viral metagenome TaxID=1070528 RepID=A0A6M3Y3V3_9ZZZZ
MTKYKSVCTSCGEEYTFERKTPFSPSSPHRKFCHQCLLENQATNNKPNPRPDRYIGKHGYVQTRVNGHSVAEHRYVMEQILGRPLKKGESVHHINGIRDDNRKENLELWVRPQQLAGQRAKDIICPHCGKPYRN